MDTTDRFYNYIEKRIRAEVIKSYLNAIGQNACVCLSCGHASGELIKVGINTTALIKPVKWYTQEEIQNEYHLFDATSGHLPVFLMQRIAERIYKELPKPDNNFELPTGSGETYVCMKMAFPFVNIIPVYNLDDSTKWHEKAPLNILVDALYNKTKINFK